MTTSAANGVQTYSRRQFLQAGSAGVGAAVGVSALSSPTTAAATSGGQKTGQVILLFLTGGPSQLETWDPKPSATAENRGPFQAISTRVPGMQLSERFPRMADRADQFALLRSLYHGESPIHETGHQLINSGFLFRQGIQRPSVGSVTQSLKQRSGSFVLGGRLGNTGVDVPHGQDAGDLGRKFDPQYAEISEVDPRRSEQYGRHRFGLDCLRAAQLVESGADFVTVNMFQTVFEQPTWDCHANGGDLSTTFADYAQTVCPMFDQAYSALLDDLRQRGLWESTLVLAVGEFGRTPKINSRGGRDHWPGVWTAVAAGGRVPGGAVIGGSDRNGAEPVERPIHAAELAATLYEHMGVDSRQKIRCGRHDALAITQADPIAELLG